MAHSHSHGGGHSHDDAYPDDDWNLYQHIERAEGLNGTLVGGGEGVTVSWGPADSTGKARCVFKPHARRLEPAPSLSSDADEQIIVKVQFNVPVSVRKIMVIGAGPSDNHPSSVQCFVGRTAEQLDFSELDGAAPAQVAELALNDEGEGYFNTVSHALPLWIRFANALSGSDHTLPRAGARAIHQHHGTRALLPRQPR